jgi:hypothetical protein
MKEGSGSGAGSIPLTSGSGSGSRRPKKMRTRWIRIRIRIRNTAWKRSSGALCCWCPLAEVSFSDACFRFTATWLRGAGSSALGNQTIATYHIIKSLAITLLAFRPCEPKGIFHTITEGNFLTFCFKNLPAPTEPNSELATLRRTSALTT